MPMTSRQPPKSAKSPPRRRPNTEERLREHLTSQEVQQLYQAARSVGRHGHRDALMILMMFRHALRVSEAVQLRWEQVDLRQGLLHVKRVKQGLPATHPLRGTELRALRQLQREYIQTPYLFISERLAPLSVRTAHHIVARAGRGAEMPFTVHPHMLRHATGFYLANQGHDTRAIQAYLGHANIHNTTRYTALSAKRFQDFWQD